MFDNVPSNLPVGGKNLLDNVSPPNAAAPPPPKPSAPPPAPKAEPAKSAPPPASKPMRTPPAPPSATDDIFAEIKEAPAMSPAPKQQAKDLAETIVETPRQGFKKIILTVGLIVVFAGVLFGGGYWAYVNFLQPKALSPSLNFDTGPTQEVSPAAEETQPAETVAEPVVIDSDNDGLTDDEEKTLGTDPFTPDSDGDRLFDGEEANVYKTDPLNKDTDGDTFEDGAEVQAGYDPKGPGKLIRIPAGE